jgi:hypothetical protein
MIDDLKGTVRMSPWRCLERAQIREKILSAVFDSGFPEKRLSPSWEDLLWNTREAWHFNRVSHRRQYGPLARLWRPQGRINRLNLRAFEICEERFQTLLQTIMPSLSSVGRQRFLRECGRPSGHWEKSFRIRQMNLPQHPRVAILSRWRKDQAAINSAFALWAQDLMQRWFLIRSIPSGAFIRNFDEWEDLQWHTQALQRLLETNKSEGFFERLRFNQFEFNRLLFMNLTYQQKLLERGFTPRDLELQD